jgi:D-aspartate ligase
MKRSIRLAERVPRFSVERLRTDDRFGLEKRTTDLPVNRAQDARRRKHDSHRRRTPTPVLLLGGDANSIAITRSLGRRGIPVRVSCKSKELAPHSRFCAGSYPLPADGSPVQFWEDLLLGTDRSGLHGSVLLPCSDDGLEFMAAHRASLETRYLLDDYLPELVLAMLDKQRTAELARSLDIPIPDFRAIDSLSDLDGLEKVMQFPLIVKPVHSHLFQRHYPNRKYLEPKDFDQLRRQVGGMLEKRLRLLVCERIPGPDSLLSSYYTYVTRDGTPLFHFTKRIIRRYPVNEGGATYHATDWLPETAELGQRFFQGIGLRGLGNIELKRDPRDGKLKVIESNLRFTQAHQLLVDAGMDSALIIYNYITGRPQPDTDSYKTNLTLLFPESDYYAFRQLNARGELTPSEWLRSIARRHSFPYFSLSDPWPSLRHLGIRVFDKCKKVWNNRKTR